MSAPTAWARAHALAEAHGHAWACLRSAPSSSEEAETLWASVTAEELGPCGGLGPSLAHITGTGRLRWWISPQGTVILHVARPAPAGDVLAARVDEGGSVHVDLIGEACLRHWSALRLALKALGLRLPEGRVRDVVEAAAAAWDYDQYSSDRDSVEAACANALRVDAAAEAVLAEEREVVMAAQAAVTRARHLTREATR